MFRLSPRAWLLGSGLFAALAVAGIVTWATSSDRTAVGGIALLLASIGCAAAAVGWFARSQR